MITTRFNFQGREERGDHNVLKLTHILCHLIFLVAMCHRTHLARIKHQSYSAPIPEININHMILKSVSFIWKH